MFKSLMACIATESFMCKAFFRHGQLLSVGYKAMKIKHCSYFMNKIFLAQRFPSLHELSEMFVRTWLKYVLMDMPLCVYVCDIHCSF